MNEHEHLGHERLAHEHVNDDVLIDGLYGLADVEARIGSCAVCVSRWSDFQERRASVAVPMTVPPSVLAAQRRNVYSQIEHPLRIWEKPGRIWEKSRETRWAGPAMAGAAAACVLAIGLFVHHPATPAIAVPPAAAPVSEAQPLSDIYSDVYSMEQSFEPSASASLRVLFEADGSAVESPDQGAKQ